MSPRPRTLLLALVLLLGAWLRLDGLGEAALFGDEYHTQAVGELPLPELLTRFDMVGSHVLVPVLQHLSLSLFGPGVVSFRLVAVVPGILTLLVLFLAGRRLLADAEGRPADVPALLATLALAVHPMHVFYSRYGRAYALVLLLGVLLAWGVVEALRAEPRSAAARRRWVAVLVVAVLLPVAHLSSVGTVLATGLAASAVATRRRGAAAGARVLALFAVGALLSGAAFLPVLEDVRAYFAQTSEVKDQPSTWFGIALLLAGGVGAAWVWLVGFVPGLALLARERRDAALVVAASALGPALVLAATRPHGMEYAWARYLLGFVPFVPLVLALLLQRGLARAGGPSGERLTLALGAALLLGFLLGPARAPRPSTGTFDNTYLAMRPLPPFDAPWPGASPYYAELAAEDGDLVVVEAGPLLTRAVLLYRNHAFVHGKRVRMSWPARLSSSMGSAGTPGPYVDLNTIGPADADVVIVHRNLPREVRAYWRFVYGGEAGAVPATDRGLFLRHEANFIAGQVLASADKAEEYLAFLRTRFGPATYKDDAIVVWRLDR